MALNFDHQRNLIGSSSNNITINTTGGLTLPVGSTIDRPSPAQGMIRYNTTDSRFEAYNGTTWIELGGVFDVDRNTYIIAETSPGVNNNELDFYTDGNKRMQLGATGNLTFGSSLNKFTINYTSGDTTIAGQTSITAVNSSTNTTNGALIVNGGVGISENLNVGGNVVVTGDVSINGNLTFGNADSDSITINADINSNLVPDTTGDYDIGQSSKAWRNIYITDALTFEGATTENNIIIPTNLADALSIKDSNNTDIVTFNTVSGRTIFKGILDVDSTSALIIPVGTTLERPTAEQGMVRYNTTDSRFEAHNGTAWTGLGGVIDVDQNTYIIAETSPGANNNELDFYTDAVRRLQLGSSGNFSYGNSLNKFTIAFSTGNTAIAGTLGVVGESTLASAIVSDLTNNRITIAGTAGALEDDANFRFDGTNFDIGAVGFEKFRVVVGSGNTDIDGILDVAGQTTLATLNVLDITSGRVPYATTNGQLVDSANLTFDGTDLNATASVNITGDLDVDNININGNTIVSTDTNGNINITPAGTGEVVASTLTVSDLTDNRLVLSGASGALEDSANLTYDGSTFDILTSVNITGDLDVDNININGNTVISTDTNGNINLTPNGVGEVVIATATVSDLTDNRLVIAGTAGSIEDDANLTFNGTTFDVGQGDFTVDVSTGNTFVNGTFETQGLATLNTAVVENLTNNRIVIAGATSNLEDDANLTFDGTDLNATASVNITGDLDVDNININGNTIISTDTNGNINLTPAGSGEVVASTLTVSDLTAGRVVYVGTAGALVDSSNMTFDGNALSVSGGIAITGETTVDSIVVSDLTNNRIVIAGTAGAVEDDANLTYDGTDLTTNSLVVGDLTSTRIVLAGTSGAIEDSANLTYNGTTFVVGLDKFTVASSTGNTAVTGNLTVDGDLIINGITTTVNSTTVTLDDPILTLGNVPLVDDNKDRGIEFRYFNGSSKVGFFGFDDSTGRFTFVPDATNTSEVFSGTAGDAAFNAVYATHYTGSNVRIAVSGSNEIDTLSGNLTIDSAGGTTTIDDILNVTGAATVNALSVNDVKIVLNSDETIVPTADVYFEVERGSSNNVSLRWNEALDDWEQTSNGTNYYKLVSTNDNYISALTAGAGISITHTPAAGSTATIATANIPNSSLTNSAITITDGATSQVVDLGETLTFADGTDINVVVSATNTLTVNHNVGGANASQSATTNTFANSYTVTSQGHVTAIGTGTVDFNVADNYAFKTFTDGSNSAVADSNTDTFTFDKTEQITVLVDAATDKLTIGHATSGVSANTYGSGTAIPIITVDAQGHITGVTTTNLDTTLNIAGDGATTDSVSLLTGTLTFAGDTGITATVGSDTVTIDLDDTAVTPNTYGSTTAIPVITVDQQGRITSASTANVATTLNIAGDSATSDAIDLLNDTLTFVGDTGITVTVGTNSVTVDLDDTAVIPNTYGSTTAIPIITVDQQGRITSVTTASVTSTFTITDGVTSESIANGDNITFADGTDINMVVTATDTVTVNNTSTLATVTGRGATTTNAITVGSATVSNLANNRLVVVGPSGLLEDDANLTFDGTDLTVTAGVNITGDLDVDNININSNTVISTNTDGNINITPNGAGEVIASTLTVSDLTNNRLVIAGTSGALEDDANLTFDGTNLNVTASVNITGDLDVDNINIDGNTVISTNTDGNINITPNGTGEVVISTAAISDLTSGRVTYAGTSGALQDSANLTFDGTDLTVASAKVSDLTSGRVTYAGASGALQDSANLTFDGTDLTVASAKVSDLTSGRVTYAGASGALQDSANLTYNGTDFNITAAVNVTGDLDVDNINIDGNTIISTDTNGNINITPNGAGEVIASTLTVGDLTSGRVLLAGTSGSLTDSSNLTFNGTQLIVGASQFTVDVATGNTQIVGTLDVNGQATFASANVEDLTSGRVVITGSTGELADTANLTFVSTELTASSLTVSDLTNNRIVIAGTSGALEDDANFTFDGTDFNVTASVNITGDLAVDNININGNTIISTDTNGNINITPNGVGEVVIASATISDLTNNRLVVAGTAGVLEDDASLTFDGTTFAINTNKFTVDVTSGDVTIAGDLTVNGTTTTVNSTTVTIDDPVFTLGGDTAPAVDDNKDRGIEFKWYDGSAKVGFFGFDDSSGKFTFIPDATNTSEVFSGTVGDAAFGNIDLGSAVINNIQLGVTSSNTIDTQSGDLVLSGFSGEISLDDNVTVTGTLDVTGVANFNDTTGSTSTTSGALIVDGGAGIAENLYVGGGVHSVNNFISGYSAYTPIAYTSAPSYAEGLLWYNNDAQTLVLYSDNTDFNIYVGEREWLRGRNTSGAPIYKGQPVYATGVHIPGHPIHGHHPTIALADASDVNKIEVLGLAAHDIADGTHGYVIVRGYIDNIDTSGLTTGQRVHLGFASPGDIVQTAPAYPNYPVDLGICLTADATLGTLYIDITSHTQERLRVTGTGRIDGDFTVGGNLTILGTSSSVTLNNLSVDNNFIYLNAGDTIGESNTNFTGSGLDDAALVGHFEGLVSTHFYVRIDSVGGGTAGVDTFEWSLDNFSTTEATGVDITSSPIALQDNISVVFQATTGHTLNDVWDGTAAPVNVDIALIGNRNTGTSGVGYTHLGLMFDVSDEKWKIFSEYDPEPSTTIDVNDVSFTLGTLVANTFEGALLGNASTATKWATARTVTFSGGDVTGNFSIDGSGDVSGVALTIAADSVALGTDTTGNYVTSITNGSYITGANGGSEGAALTLAVDATSANTVSKVVARDASGNFSAGTITAALTGNASTATKWATARTVTFATGDVTGNFTLDGSGDVSNVALTIAANSVALGTDTTGNYIATGAVSGNGLSGSASSEGATFTVTSNATTANTPSTIVFRDASGNFTAGTITAALTGNASTATKWAAARTVTFSGGDVTGNFSIDGSGDVSGVALTIAANSVALGTDTTGNYVTSITNGSYITGGNGGSEGAALTLAVDATSANTVSKVVARDASGDFSAGTITAALTGNASTATTWATARTVTFATGDVTGNFSIDGSGDVSNVALTIAADSVALGTDTTGSYVQQGATSGNGLSGSINAEAGTFTVTSNATNANTSSTIVFRDASGNFSAGTITANLTGNISGSAASLTTTRTLWGQNFNGTANVTGNLTSVGNITGTAGITISASGTNQNIVLTPSGVGYTLLNGNVGINVATPAEKLHVDGAVRIDSTYNLDSATATTTSTSQTAIASFSATTFGGGKIAIQAYDTITGERTISEMLIIHNGATASATEYGIVNTGAGALATYDVDISGGNVRILATSGSTNSTQYKVVQTLILA